MTISNIYSIFLQENNHKHSVAEEVSPENKKLNLIIQISSAIGLLLLVLIFGLIPLFVKSCKENLKLTGIANSFSCGIFISVAIIHILPEAIEDMNSYLKSIDSILDIPICNLISFFSFSLILFIEKVVFNSHSLIDHGHDHGNHGKNDQEDLNNDEEDEDEDENMKNMMTTTRKFGTLFKLTCKESSPNEVGDIEKKTTYVYKNIKRNSTSKIETVSNQEIKGNFKSFILLFALSFHGLFEGIAIGYQKTATSTISIIIAIFGHKWAEGLTLGLSFSKGNTKTTIFVLMILIFALFTPIGIAIGIVLNNTEGLPGYIQPLCLSLTVGTFIYISCGEIISEEFTVTNNKWIKFVFLILGIVLIVGLTIWEHV